MCKGLKKALKLLPPYSANQKRLLPSYLLLLIATKQCIPHKLPSKKEAGTLIQMVSEFHLLLICDLCKA